MKGWLSREANGLYMLTATRPKRCVMRGTNIETLYVRPGDPIGVRHLCPRVMQRLFGVELEPLQSVRVSLTGSAKGTR